MSDELTAELRRVYEDATLNAAYSDKYLHDAALLAVARHSAERQRIADFRRDYFVTESIAAEEVRQSAAPLWVDKK